MATLREAAEEVACRVLGSEIVGVLFLPEALRQLGLKMFLSEEVGSVDALIVREALMQLRDTGVIGEKIQSRFPHDGAPDVAQQVARELEGEDSRPGDVVDLDADA